MLTDYAYDTRGEIVHGDAYAAFAEIKESTEAPGTLDTSVVPSTVCRT